MAVLVEAISVIVRKDAISHRIPGGMSHFRSELPNRTFCEDDRICRIGFLSPEETASFADKLQALGLDFLDDSGAAMDFAVVDQQHGPTTVCTWLAFGRIPCNTAGNQVSACWLDDSDSITTDELTLCAGTLSTPAGWAFESSLSKNFQFTPTATA